MSDDLHALLREAEDYYSQRDWDLALETYKKIMQLDPQNDEACEKLARIYAIRGLLSDVIAQYFQLLQILDDRGELDLALEIARWVMQLQPENDRARLAQINILRKRGQNDEVVRQSLQLARLYIELGMGDQSIDLLKNAQEMEPENLDIGYELAEMYVSHGHIQEGVAQFRQIANSFLQQEQYEKAADAFKRMKVIQSDDPSLLFTLGQIYETLGRLNDAEAEFRSILRHDLNHVEALLALGNVCQKKGQFRDAILAFNKILTINPDENVAKEKLGELYQAQGNVNEAIKQYLGAAHAYQQVEETERSIRLYQRVVNLDPTNPTACRELTNMGAPMVPDDPADLGTTYQPVIAPVGGPDGQPPMGEPGRAEEEGGRKGRGRAKNEATGSSLVPREGGSGGGKSVLPRPGLMNARGGGGLVAKGDGGPATLKRRLGDGGGGGDKPSLGARSRMSEVAGGDKPQLMKRGEAETAPVYEEEEAFSGGDTEAYAEEPRAPEPVHSPEPEPEVHAAEPDPVPAPEPPRYIEDAPVAAEPVPEPTPVVAEVAPLYDAEPQYFEGAPPAEPEPQYEAAEVAPAPDDSGTGPELGEYDPTMFPSLEQPSGREEMEAPPVVPVEPPATPVASAPEESHDDPVSSRAPLQPRLFARGGGRSSGSKPSRPVLGGGGGGPRGKSETAKPTLPVRTPHPETAEPTPTEPAATEEPVVLAAEPAPVPTPEPTIEQFDAPVFEGPPEDLLQPSEGAATHGSPPQPPVEDTPPPQPAADESSSQPVESLPTVGAVAASAEAFDGARALHDLTQGIPSNTFGDAAFEVARLEEYIGTGDLSRAVLAFRQHLHDNPNDFDMRARLADALFVTGCVEEAAGEYLQMAHLDPENMAVLQRLVDSYLWSDAPERAVDLLVTMSYLHRQTGDVEAAFGALQDALTVQRDNARARLELAELYRQSGADDLANWHLRAMAEIADEVSDASAAVETWRKIFELSGSAADQERLAGVLEKYERREEAVEEYRKLAVRAQGDGDPERARRFYERVVELSPSDTEAHHALLDIYQSSGDDSQALDKMRVLAAVARQGGDLDTALRLYEDMIRRGSSDVTDRTVLVELYLDKGLINNARNEAQGLLEAWYRDNRFDAAIPLLQRFISAMPDDVLPREQLVHFYEKAGEADRALDERIGLAHLHLQRGAPEDALKVYQKALSLDDRDPQLHFEMGVLYADHLNDPAAAEQRFLKVQQLDSTHKEAIRRLVQLQLQLGKPHEAIARLSDLIQLAPENASIRDELLAEYRRRAEERPDDMQGKFTLGLLYRISGQIEDAIVLFQDTRKAHELFLASCNMLGLCFWQRRAAGPASAATEEAAIKWFKRGIETKGYPEDDYLELRYNLAEVHNHRNEVMEALKLYQDIYALDMHYRDVAEKMKQLEDEMKGGGKVTRLRTS